MCRFWFGRRRFAHRVPAATRRVRYPPPARSQYVTSNQHGGQGDFGIALCDFCTFSLSCSHVFCPFSHADVARTSLPRRGVPGIDCSEAVASPGLAAARLALMRRPQPSIYRDKAKLLPDLRCCYDKTTDTSRCGVFPHVSPRLYTSRRFGKLARLCVLPSESVAPASLRMLGFFFILIVHGVFVCNLAVIC